MKLRILQPRYRYSVNREIKNCFIFGKSSWIRSLPYRSFSRRSSQFHQTTISNPDFCQRFLRGHPLNNNQEQRKMGIVKKLTNVFKIENLQEHNRFFGCQLKAPSNQCHWDSQHWILRRQLEKHLWPKIDCWQKNKTKWFTINSDAYSNA